MSPAVNKSRGARAELAVALLTTSSLLAAALTGCAAARVPQLEYELGATQTALEAQMEATASLEDEETRLEAAIAEAEDRARARAEALEELEAKMAAEEAASFDLDEESVEPGAEAAPSEEEPALEELTPEEILADVEIANEEPLSVVEEEPSDSGEMMPGVVDPWAQVAGLSAGYPAGMPYGDVSLVNALNNIARSLDEQKILMIMEARLADKQRLMDYHHGVPGPMIPGVTSAAGASAGTSAVAEDDPLRAQVAQLAQLQQQMLEKLAAEEAAKEAAAAEEAAAEEQAAEEAALAEADAAAAAERAREEARWNALMARLEAIEAGAARTAEGAPEAGEQEQPEAAEAGDEEPEDPEIAALRAQLEALQSALEKADPSPALGQLYAQVEALKAQLSEAENEAENDEAARVEAAVAEDPEVAALRAELEAIRAEQARREREAQLATTSGTSSAGGSSARVDEDDEAARLEALLAEQQAAIEAQNAQLAKLEESQEQERQWYQRMFDRLSGHSPAPAATQPVVPQPTVVTIPQSNISNEELLAAINELKKAMSSAEAGERDAAQSEAEARLSAERADIQSERERIQAELEALREQPVEDPSQAQAELDALRAEMAELRARETQVQQLQEEINALKNAEAERKARIQAKVQPLIDQGLQVEIHGDRVRVLLPSDVLFASGSSTLSEAGQATVREVAAVLKPLNVDIQIEGHTDNVPMYGGKTNWDLSYERARNVLQTMADAGIPANLLSAAAFGDSRPIASNDTEEGRAKNRRIEITLRIEDEG